MYYHQHDTSTTVMYDTILTSPIFFHFKPKQYFIIVLALILVLPLFGGSHHPPLGHLAMHHVDVYVVLVVHEILQLLRIMDGEELQLRRHLHRERVQLPALEDGHVPELRQRAAAVSDDVSGRRRRRRGALCQLV